MRERDLINSNVCNNTYDVTNDFSTLYLSAFIFVYWLFDFRSRALRDRLSAVRERLSENVIPNFLSSIFQSHLVFCFLINTEIDFKKLYLENRWLTE